MNRNQKYMRQEIEKNNQPSRTEQKPKIIFSQVKNIKIKNQQRVERKQDIDCMEGMISRNYIECSTKKQRDGKFLKG